MADALDKQDLLNYLTACISAFEAMDGRMDPQTSGNARVAGALLALGRVRTEISAGSFDLPA